MTKNIQAIKQQPQDLMLAVVQADNLPTTHELQSKVVYGQHWACQLSIIGESHRVRMMYDGRFVLEEMLACVPIVDQRCGHYHSFSDLQAHDFSLDNYHVSVWMDTKSEWQSTASEMVYLFPAIDGVEAATRIQWQVSDTHIQWRTSHHYIDGSDSLIIYSESNYTFKSED